MKFLSIVVVAAVSAASTSITTAFTGPFASPRQRSNKFSFEIFNVPPPASDDVEAVRDYASKLAPPGSFFQLQQDCLEATVRAIDDGQTLMEIEFPPLPANVLELDDVSAYDVASANLQLAIEFSRAMVQTKGPVQNVSILLPDEDEKSIAIERYTGKSRDQVNEDTYRVADGVTVSSLRRIEAGDERLIKPEQTFLNLFGMGDQSSEARSGAVRPIDGTDMYVVLVASAQELPDIEALAAQVPDTPIVFYNLKLDILRGDLGAPAFPPKDFQDRFLSRVKPVYFLRTRQYSRSIAAPPFLVNFQGCLFRSYPGEYQTLLDTGKGSYRRLKGSNIRPGLGAFKEELTDALKESGILPMTEGGALDFLRVGYKTTTWWEEFREEASMEWKT